MNQYPESVHEASMKMIRAGTTAIELATTLGVARGTAYKWLRQMRANGENVAFVKRPGLLRELAIARLLAGISPTTICNELGLSAAQLDRWATALKQADTSPPDRPDQPVSTIQSEPTAAKRSTASETAKDVAIRQLQTALAEKQMLLDFFEGALQKVKALRHPHSGHGETESTRRSAR